MALKDIFAKKQDEPAQEQRPQSPPMPPGMQGGAGAPPQPPQAPPLPSEVPLQQVVSMQSQGLTNNQIIQSLQRQGYDPQNIYDALAQAETRQQVEPMPPSEPEPAPPQGGPSAPYSRGSMNYGGDTEALVEQIVEEKWRDLQKDLAKINEWKDSVTSRVDKIEQSVTDMKSDLDGLHKAIVARVGEYDKTLMDVGTEIKAMEKVFQQVLPELTGNIQELSRITKGIKEEPRTKK